MNKDVTKAAFFVAFIVAAIILVRLTPIREWLTVDQLSRFLDTTGFWAPLVFMVSYAFCVPVYTRHCVRRIGRCYFRDYFLGTSIGIIVGTFTFLFFIGTLKEIWGSGNWGELISSKVIFSIALFVFSLFIPKIIKRFKEGT